jgi:DNA-nicking Smr family endonuclease
VKKPKLPKKKFEFNSVEDLFYSQDEFDYHDLGPMTPFDIEENFNRFIEDSYFKMLRYVTIVTGKGQVVRPLVQRLLKTNKYVEKFKNAGYFNGQDGAFEVTLKAKILQTRHSK